MSRLLISEKVDNLSIITLLSFYNSDVLEYRWVGHRTEPCEFSLVDFSALVFRIVFEEYARNPVLLGRGSANGYAFGFGVLHTAFDALADDVAFQLTEYAHHFQHTLGHGVKLLCAIDNE